MKAEMETVYYENLSPEEQAEVRELRSLYSTRGYNEKFYALKSSDFSLRAWKAFLQNEPSAFDRITEPSDDIIDYAVFRYGYNISCLSEEQQTLPRVILALKGWNNNFSDSSLKSPLMRVFCAELRVLFEKIKRTEGQLREALHQAKMRELDSCR